MKNLTICIGALSICALFFTSCEKENSTTKDTQVAVKTDPMSIGPVINPLDSTEVPSAKFSDLKNGDVNLDKDAITLSSMREGNSEKAYLLFNEDQSKAEIFLPNDSNSLVLDRKGTEGNYTWTDGKYELIVWKGYILQTLKQGTKLFAGDVKM